ncbi:thioredoxin family protein [Fulvivirga sediminis]|uniref:Thioredoxin family protein n=1 Tax=Fulvivirga sediminis TaxID=2803949 RepID=A0A937F5J7_9BACT|nr:thioredoxin family protein [Fulvivirga sediminis]MBL3654720.1 thioredoxin family protein [Fulvivirga sediminis]
MEKKIVSDEEFEKVINAHDKVMVKFSADWCGVCKRFAPIYNRLAAEEKYGHINFVEVSAEQAPKTRLKAGVYSLPFFATFEKGALKDKVTSDNKEKVIALLEEL